jgi:hypothetical protein
MGMRPTLTDRQWFREEEMEDHHPDIFREGPDWMLLLVNACIIASFVGLILWMIAAGYVDAVGGIGELILTLLMVLLFAAAAAVFVGAIIYALMGLVELIFGGPVRSRMTLAFQLVVAALVLVLLAYAAAFVLAILSGHDFNPPHGRWG